MFESPVIGTIGRRSELARLCADLGLLLDSGMTLDRALVTVCPKDPHMTVALKSVLRSIKEGETFTEAVSHVPAFPALFGAFVAVGEETGNLPKLLRAQALLLETDTELRTADTIRLIEPAAMSVLGALVGFVVLGCFLPIYQLIGDHL
jgi:type IV pilus assembly protein PilC